MHETNCCFNINKDVYGFLIELTVYLLLFRVVCLCSEILFLFCTSFTAAVLCNSPCTNLLHATGTWHFTPTGMLLNAICDTTTISYVLCTLSTI